MDDIQIDLRMRLAGVLATRREFNDIYEPSQWRSYNIIKSLGT